MALKKELSPQTAVRDIDSLFSRAGMKGVKYKEFPRLDAVSSASSGSDGGMAALGEPVSVSAVKQTVETASQTALACETGASLARWSSLEQVFGERLREMLPRPAGVPVAKVAMVSLAGGAGKTTLAATLARALSGFDRQVLVADCGLLPGVELHFGTRRQRLGPMQFFYAHVGAISLPVGVFRLAASELQGRKLHDLLEQIDCGGSVLLMDIPTLQAANAIASLGAEQMLVPLTPDVHSIATLPALRQMVDAGAAAGFQPQVHYLLNRFDPSRILHREIRARLEQQLGSSLLPIAIEKDAAIEEASAKGMTIVDYRPESEAARQFGMVADWLRLQVEAKPATRRDGQ